MEKNSPARSENLPSRKGDPLAEPTFCFSRKQFAMFCKGMYEKLAQLPRVAEVGKWPFYKGQRFSV